MDSKGKRYKECVNPCCNTIGANSAELLMFPAVYYCQDCAKLRNDESLRYNKKATCIVKPNQVK
jgi:hypothetical protein